MQLKEGFEQFMGQINPLETHIHEFKDEKRYVLFIKDESLSINSKLKNALGILQKTKYYSTTHNILLKFFDKVDQGDEQKNAQGAFDKIKIWKVKNRITPENIPSMINKERAQIHVSLNN